jgi:S-adenosyl-L-methionine hydrolase (adenosine-forming)
MQIITLTTDWGTSDHFAAAFKGKILSALPSATIIDISHSVEPFNTIKASYVLKNSYANFPDGTIHFVGVMRYDNIRSHEPRDREIHRLIIRCNNHFFIGSDSGIFSLVLGDAPKEIVMLPPMDFRNEAAKYVEAIAHIAAGKPIAELGAASDNVSQSYMLKPVVDNGMVRCNIIYIDSFGNAVTNLSSEQFEEARKARKFTLWFPDNSHYLTNISSHYTDVVSGEAVALFNSAGLLEVAQNSGNANKLMGLKLMDTVRIEFYES